MHRRELPAASLGGVARDAARFVAGDALAAGALAVAQEGFAGEAADGEGRVLVAQLVPQGVEAGVVGPELVVRELVQHGVHDHLEGLELARVGGVAEAETDLLAGVGVETWGGVRETALDRAAGGGVTNLEDLSLWGRTLLEFLF